MTGISIEKIISGFLTMLVLLFTLADPCFAQAKRADEGSKEDALQALRAICVEKPTEEDISRAKALFKDLKEDIAIPVAKQILSEDCNKDMVLWLVECFIDDPSIIPEVVKIARSEKGTLRMSAVRIFRKIPDKRALPVLIEECLYDPEEYHHRDELHDVYITSIFINSAMALHTLTDGAIGIEPSERNYVDLKLEIEIGKKKDKIIDKCEKWWAENKDDFFKELEKEYGVEEVKRYKEAPPKKPDNTQKNTPKKKNPSPPENANKGTDQDSTPGAEKKKPPPTEGPKPEDKPSPRQTELGNELLTVSLIVLGLVIAGFVAFLLISRRRKT